MSNTIAFKLVDSVKANSKIKLNQQESTLSNVEGVENMGLMSEEAAREAIVSAGDVLYQQGYVVSNDGNISVRIASDIIVVTPTGVSKGGMNPDMMVVMDLDGNVLSQGKRGPSSEVKMHIRVYRENQEIAAVVHAHPIYATSFAIAGVPLDRPILSEAMLQVGVVPVAHYAKPGTTDVPDSIAPFVNSHAAVLLSNHGALTWGVDLEQALTRMEVVENYARVSLIVGQIGKERALSASQVDGLSDIRRNMGLSSITMPKGVEEIVNNTDVLSSIE